MFSGIIEGQARLVKKKCRGKHLTLTFQTRAVEKPFKRGESVSVNGVCLTVVGRPNHRRFTVEVVPETFVQTTLGRLRHGETVNLERSLKWGERIGGHFVLGHIDGVGQIVRRRLRGKSITLHIEAPSSVLQHLVPKGSIAIEGVSFTIQKLSSHRFTVAVVPHTAKNTTLGKKKQRELVNLEADVIAKHLARLIHPPRSHAAVLV